MVCLCAFATPHSITFISATNLTLDAFATNPVNLAFRQRDIKKGVTTIVLLNFGTVRKVNDAFLLRNCYFEAIFDQRKYVYLKLKS